MDMVVILVLTAVVLSQATVVTGFDAEKEHLLRTSLLSNYHRMVRPNATTFVKIAFNLLTIHQLDIKSQMFSTSGWLTVAWHDYRMQWVPAAHGDTEHLYFLESEIWRPELLVDNSLANIGIISDSNLWFRARYTGEIDWEPPRLFDTHCEVDITYYPFDTQICGIEVTSWALTNTEMDLQHLNSGVNLEDYRKNGEWDITSTSLASSELIEHTENETEIFSQLKFNIHIQRKPTFYIINTILPILLTSILTVVVFALPAESGEKVSYSLTVLLALAVLLTLIADSMPSTSLHVSILGLYLAVTLFYGALAVVLQVIVLRLHHRRDNVPVSPSMRKFVVSFLAPITCFERSFCKRTDSVGAQDSDAIVMTKESDAPIGMSKDGWDKEQNTSETQYTWQEISVMTDTFFFFLLGTLTFVSTLVFLSILGSGKSTNTA